VKVKELLDFLIDKQILSPEFPIQKLRNWDKESLPELYENAHSWAGDQGCVAILLPVQSDIFGIKTLTSIIHLKSGGWYSENGRITRDDPNENAYEQIVREGAKVGDILIIHRWDNYNHPSYKFSDYYYYLITSEDIEQGAKIIVELESKEVGQ